MKKDNTLLKIGGIFTVPLIILGFIIMGFSRYFDNYSYIINENWSIKIPRDYEEIYKKDSGPSFHGDGLRYHIFKYERSEKINDIVSWSDTADLYQGKNRFLEGEVTKILSSLEVPSEHYPSFHGGYMYYYEAKEDSSRIFMLHDYNSKVLYVVEDFM